MFELLLLVIAAFFAGYIIGKKRGRILGEREVSSSYPLLLRQQSFEKGYCLLCRDIAEPPSHNEQDGKYDA